MMIVWIGFLTVVLVLNLVAWQTYWWAIGLFLVCLAGKTLQSQKWKRPKIKLTGGFALLVCLLIIGRSIWLVHNKTPKIPNLNHFQTLEGEIIDQTHQQILITTKEYGRGWLFLNSKRQKDNFANGEKIIFQGKWKRLAKKGDRFYWWMRSYNVKGSYSAHPKSSLKIKSNQTLRNKIRTWLLDQHQATGKKWIKTLLFQERTPPTLSIDWKEKVQKLGVYHFFVVSGFHLLIFSWPIRIWLRKCQNKFYYLLGSGLLLITMGWLVWLTDFKLTATKAWLFIASRMFWRKFSSSENLAVWLLIFLLYWPLYLFRVGFQISFLASFLVGLKQKYHKKWWKKLFLKGKQSFLITLVLIPILMSFQTGFSLLIGINQIIFLLWSTLFYPFFFLTIWWSAFQEFWHFWFQQSNNLINWLWKYKAFYLIGEWPDWINIFYYGLFFVLTLKWKNKKELLTIMILVTALFAVAFINEYKNNQTQLHFIDVGHGQAILVKVPSRKLNLLFDAGVGKQKISYSRKVLHYLQRERIKKLQAVFISHHNTDHYNNLPFLQKRIKIEQIYRFDNPKPQYTIKGLKIWNLNFKEAKFNRHKNNQGLVLAMKLEEKWLLLPFDLEKLGEKQLIKGWQLPAVTFFQVGHHGSITSSHRMFLEKVQPSFCFISNQKRLNLIVKNRLNRFCQALHTTREKGNIKIRITRNKQVIETEKGALFSSMVFW